MSSDYQAKIPVGGIYILDPSGIPLFARYYQGEIDKTDSTLLGGFFSAIEIFVKTSLDGLLSDIGMTDSRYFFDRFDNGYILVIIVFTKDFDFVNDNTLNIIRTLQDTIGNCFEVLEYSSEVNMVKIEQLIENLGTTIDSFLVETSLDYLKVEYTEENYLENINSQQLSNEKLDSIIDNIKSNR